MKPLDIINTVCAEFGFVHEDIIPTKPKEQQSLMHVTCRQLCVYFMLENTALSLKGVGFFFNKNGDHCFALHANKAAKRYIDRQDYVLYPYYLKLKDKFN